MKIPNYIAITLFCLTACSSVASQPETSSIAQTVTLATSVKPSDIHAGMVFESQGTIYWIGDSYGCGYVLGSPQSKYCGEVGYSAPSLTGPWFGPTLLFDPQPWQARCGAPNYGCFRPHVVWNPNTNDWRLWLNVASIGHFSYAVFSADQPLGPYNYIGDASLSVGSIYGDETVFVDNNVGYAIYTVIGAHNSHSIAIEQLDASFQTGTGKALVMPIPQWVESPAMFNRDGYYYLVYSDPTCAFCTAAGTSYARGTSPMGPWQEIRHSITYTSCNGQPASVNYIQGSWLYQSDLWTGSMDEASAKQWWETLNFVGPDIAGLTCEHSLI